MPPWESNGCRLVSLYDMLQFSAEEWNAIVRELDRLAELLLSGLDIAAASIEGEKSKLTDPLDRIMRGCVTLHLDMSASYADELIKRVNETIPLMSQLSRLTEGRKVATEHDLLKPDEFTREISILRKRIDDELKNRQFLTIEPSKSRYYRCRYLFGEEVSRNFPSSDGDIEEAGNCFALDRYTACVFHLMRVMEVALRVLANSLRDQQVDPKHNRSWDSILKKFRNELEKTRADRSQEWKTEDEFYSGAAATLMAVKDAWRNPTMHVETSYDEQKALDVLNAVGAFMRHISAKLHE